VLEGNLADFTLPDILRLLAATSKTGRLALVRDGASGRVDLVDGRLRDASAAADRVSIARRLFGAGLVSAEDLVAAIEGCGGLPTDAEVAAALAADGKLEKGALAEVVREQTVDAVFDLLRWRDGNFRFDRSEDVVPDARPLELALALDEVLSEAASRLEVWPSVEERTGGLDAVVTIVRPGGGRSQVSLPPDGWTLLSFVDGQRSLAELAHLTGQGEFRTRRTLVALLDEGVVSIGDAGGPGHVDQLLVGHKRLSALESSLAGTGGAAVPPARRDHDPSRPVTAPAVAGSPRADSSLPAAPTPSPQPAASSTPPATGPAQPPAAARRPGTPSVPERTRPGPVTVRNDEVAAATASAPEGPPAPRGGRLRTDPTVDPDLVRRLIDGVESL
jgi:hypothetical protein